MAITFQLIGSSTLTSSQSSVSISSIPNTYTDLYVVLSIRQNDSNNPTTTYLKFNGSNSWDYIYAQGINGSSATAANTAASALNYVLVPGTGGSGATASTFSNHEFYIPNYTNGYKKGPLLHGVAPGNSSSYVIQQVASTFNNTQAITTVTLEAYPGQTLTTDTSIYVYGILRA